jgi:CubicO group peptidase (beta-lactamase class C family)
MTATLTAMLVEEGKLSWTTTIATVLPECLEDAKTPWGGVTLEQLLGHRAGAPHHIQRELWNDCWKFKGSATGHGCC